MMMRSGATGLQPVVRLRPITIGSNRSSRKTSVSQDGTTVSRTRHKSKAHSACPKKKKTVKKDCRRIKKEFAEGYQTRSQKKRIKHCAFPHKTCEILSYQEIIPPLNKFLTIGNGLTVGTSGINGAGRGLFATQVIRNNTLFTWYQGDLRDITIGRPRDKQVKMTADDTSHLCNIDSHWAINGIKRPVRGAGGGSFANHYGTTNAELVSKPNYQGVFLKAKNTIAPDQEILVTYSEDTLSRQAIPRSNHYSLKRAGKKIEDIGPYTCSVCDEKLGNELSRFRKHMSRHKEYNLPCCDICGKELARGALKKHISTHSKKTDREKNESDRCGKCFNRQSVLDRHSMLHVRKKAFKCPECPTYFSRAGNRDSHLRNVHGNNKFLQCLECHKRFYKVDELKIHTRAHTDVKPFMCRVCGKSFAAASKRNRHQITHSVVKKFTCQICAQAFHFRYHLKVHMHKHTGEKPYKCSQCPKTFPNSSNRKRHERGHRGGKPYLCMICQKTFSTSYARDVHSRKHTGEASFQCEKCQKFFYTSTERKVHMRKHTGEKPYKCSQCKKTFSTLYRRVEHMRIHTDEKPYPCTKCKKSFSTSRGRVAHMRTHSNDKPYQCGICNKLFSELGNKNRHERTHAGIKPYGCAYCPKSFSSLSNKSRHECIHTGAKRYKCTECKKTFVDSSNMKAHIRTHTGEKPYQCKVCHKHFSAAGNRNKHEHKMHSDKTL